VAVLPIVVQARREAARRERCAENLKKIGEALHNYGAANRVPPPAVWDGQKGALAFDTYSGYFVSNKFEPDAAELFAVITDQGHFDKMFGVAMVMGDTSHRLPSDAFTSNIVLAVIKRGREVWEIKVESTTENDGVVSLRYSTASKKSDSATFASPLIVSIPKGKHTAVQFIENDKPVKKVDMQ
jgi:hypothetical protein